MTDDSYTPRPFTPSRAADCGCPMFERTRGEWVTAHVFGACKAVAAQAFPPRPRTEQRSYGAL